MKKLIILGDTHGRTTWKEILNKEKEFDKFIFIGDYLDTHENITGEQQLENFKDIRKFKEDNKDKVVLLFGNHDFHYLFSLDSIIFFTAKNESELNVIKRFESV